MKIVYRIYTHTIEDNDLEKSYASHSRSLYSKYHPSLFAQNESGFNELAKAGLELQEKKNCRLGLVIDDITENIVISTDGNAYGVRSVSQANELGFTNNQGTFVFVQINPSWIINEKWKRTFQTYLYSKGFCPVFINRSVKLLLKP